MKLSVILPCFKEAEALPAMLARLEKALAPLAMEKEIILIDDGSPDETWAVMRDLKTRHKNLHIVRFARNFGKEAALTCGLNMATGNAAVMLDSDGQHPPEIIPAMVEKWQQGDKMVYALRQSRETDGALRRILSRAFYSLFRRITELDLPQGAGDYRLLDRQVIEAVKMLPERTRFMKGLVTWVGFKPGYVSFEAEDRQTGKSSFAFSRLISLAVDAITAFSVIPLRIWSLVGVFISASSFIYFIYLVLEALIFGVRTPGFPTIMCMMLFLGGVQLIGLGVIGEYVGRIFHEVKGRPVYIVSENLPEEGAHGFGPPPESILRAVDKT